MHSQSPHGADFKMNCDACHTSASWKIPFESWNLSAGDTLRFNHYQTNFPLTGQHTFVNCRDCHSSLVFSEANAECISCHTDMHRMTVGSDCARCHTTDNWLVDNITELHEDNGFPLLGAHAAASCTDCHISESGLEFYRIGNDCINCHLNDFNATVNPDHQSLNFPISCTDCHTIDASWIPAEFTTHDDLFPIYSGAHEGEWLQCLDCHSDPSNYAEFSCTNCHLNPVTDEAHAGVGGYVYENNACLACHPTGNADNVFDHNLTDFPLTGAHIAANCLDCHAGGYQDTPTDCAACHTSDFNQSINPNHAALGFPTDCASCHTTEPGWRPATFDIHDDYYVLNGAHAEIAHDCAACHNGDYNDTPNTCTACHLDDYNQTTNPDHVAAQFPADCQLCHTETAWAPSTFDHDQFYPFTGAHIAIADDCAACHHGDYTNTPNTCAGCHSDDYDQTVNPNHAALGFPTDCESCHTTEPGWSPATFDIHNDYYLLNGAHAAIEQDCAACHNGDYNNTPNTCYGCHAADYTQTTNPDHAAAQFPTDCQSCHTETAWTPATFDHDIFYPIVGAHTAIANNCDACHNGDYTNTPNTCYGCHASDYNQVNNPNHLSAGFPTDCVLCHTQNAWSPSTFDHDGLYFPIYDGRHEGEWNDCIDCHIVAGNFSVFSCIDCHEHDNPADLADKHEDVPGYVYESNACYACHPTGED